MTSETPTILVVEDDPMIVLGLRDSLEREQYRVLTCEDGESAIATALAEKPDLVMLDVNLPKVGGFDVCRQLRSQGFSAPIIILSSRTEQFDKVLGLENGADDYMTKPFDLHELRSRIRAHIRRYRELPGKQALQEITKKSETRRHLLAMMFTDIEGYSKLMNTNERLALDILRYHNDFMRQAIESSEGRVVEIIGDAFLAVFDSAVRAVEAGVAIQEGLLQHNEKLPERERFLVRVGIHLGDIIEDGTGVKGDAVNIAARIQALAPGGGVAISETVYDAVRNKMPLDVISLGTRKLKNIQDAYTIYSLKHPVTYSAPIASGDEHWSDVRKIPQTDSEES